MTSHPSRGRIQPRPKDERPDDTPLHRAARDGDLPLISSLIASGTLPDLTDDSGQSPLFDAAIAGETSAVKLLLDLGADISLKDDLGQTVLHTMARTCKYRARDMSDVAVIEVLLERGADVAATDADSRSALWLAIQGEHESVARILVEKDPGAHASMRTVTGYTPLHVAAVEGKEGMVRMLLKTGHQVPIVDGGRRIGSLVQARDKKLGRTPLHVAAGRGRAKVMRILIDAGADVGAVTITGETALFVAALAGHRRSVNLLLKSGADARARNNMGNTVMKELRHRQFVAEDEEEQVELRRLDAIIQLLKWHHEYMADTDDDTDRKKLI